MRVSPMTAVFVLIPYTVRGPVATRPWYLMSSPLQQGQVRSFASVSIASVQDMLYSQMNIPGK